MREMTISPSGSTPAATAIANVTAAIASGLMEIGFSPAHDRIASICGAGPTLRNTLPDVAGDIFAINNAHDFLISRGWIPRFGVALDSLPEMSKHFTPDQRVTYLVASQCDQRLFAHLSGCTVHIWHALCDDVTHLMPGRYAVAGGCTATLRCINLAYLMGYRDIRLFGLDGNAASDTNTHVQAGGDEEIADMPLVWPVHVAGRDFLAHPVYAWQAKELIMQRKALPDDVRLTVYGDSLVSWTVRAANGEFDQQRIEV